jgi:3-methyladenine DNA glycosylase AlkD
MQQAVRQRLAALAEPEYRAFSASLIPGVDNLLGVRLPQLRRIAREIASGDWRGYLAGAQDQFFEEVMLQGMIVGLVDVPLSERLSLVADFVPRIENWSVCDSFCAGLGFIRDSRAAVWEFLSPYFDSPREYDLRFALVTALTWFVEPEYLERVLGRLGAFGHDGYYARMAAAWAVSVCFARFPARTAVWLRGCGLDDFTFGRAVSKITDSLRVCDADKQAVRALRPRRRPGAQGM